MFQMALQNIAKIFYPIFPAFARGFPVFYGEIRKFLLGGTGRFLLTKGKMCGMISLAFNGHEAICGEMSEWFKEPVLKTGDSARSRGFESHSLRHVRRSLTHFPSGQAESLMCSGSFSLY